MTAINLALQLFDDSWAHNYESIHSALDDLTEDEAQWQHSSYAGIETEQNLPLPGSILWHIAHIEYYAKVYASILRNRPVSEYPDLPPSTASTLPELRSAMNVALQELRDAIAALHDEDLESNCIAEASVAEFLGLVMRHQTWHSGEIAVARRLYRTR
ncbi:MAG: DinB family protein [Ignavibacteriae bacterium]|nr:DinB family protein [Ignavibacteriota bacterium]MCB9215261.1 DinB family protein [Ignavibacteria bacterium]